MHDEIRLMGYECKTSDDEIIALSTSTHDSVCLGFRIYFYELALRLYRACPTSEMAHRLSVMKKENILEALDDEASYFLWDIQLAIQQPCGYCFRYRSEDGDCILCPIVEKTARRCYRIEEWHRMIASLRPKEVNSHSREEANRRVIEWYKAIGLE